MLRHYLLILSVQFILINLHAYTPDSTSISFKNKIVDFQIIYEADGSIPVSFEYTNTGNSPLKINRIISPGLSNILFPKDSILPGETSVINAVVNPFGRTGYYNKIINVFSNTIESPSQLIVRGKIIHGTFKSAFKHDIGGLSFKQKQLNFGYIYKGDNILRYFPVINSSDKNIQVSFSNVPSHLSFTKRFETLAPGMTGLIEVNYNTQLIDDWDFVIDKIDINVSGENDITSQLIITANIRENFALLLEDDSLSQPKVSIPVKVFNYDTISSGNKVYHEFPVYNLGEGDLNIRAVKPTCGCTAVMPQKNILSPGDSTNIIVEFNSLGFLGENKKGVTVITNDPINYKHFLWITGYIE